MQKIGENGLIPNPSPKEKGLKINAVQIPSSGEDSGEAITNYHTN
jgi:hypothetical protein